jgi:hypothetical protein
LHSDGSFSYPGLMAEHAASPSAPADAVSVFEPPHQPRPILVLAAVLTLVLITYAGVLDAPLLWDDLLLLDHPSVAKLLPLRQYLLVPFWDMSRAGDGASVGTSG